MSNSLQDFQKGIQICNSLLSIESQFADPPKVKTRHRVAGLRASISVLSIACLEEYLQKSIPEYLAPLSKGVSKKAYKNWPRKLQYNIIKYTLDVSLKEARKDLAGIHSLSLAASLVSSGSFSPSAIVFQAGNPNKKNVKNLFKRIGIEDIFSDCRADFDLLWRKPETQNFVGDKLEELVARRHSIAHTGRGGTIGRSNVIEGVEFVNCFAEAIDKTLKRKTLNWV